jgi:predicted transcriptional regulator
VSGEEFDWNMYHILVAREPISFPDLCDLLDDPSEEIEASLKRLQEKMLIENRGDMIRLLSVHEMLIRCQLKYSQESRIYMENGVIKVREDGKDGE